MRHLTLKQLKERSQRRGNRVFYSVVILLFAGTFAVGACNRRYHMKEEEQVTYINSTTDTSAWNPLTYVDVRRK